jgi:hypothetical protein
MGWTKLKIFMSKIEGDQSAQFYFQFFTLNFQNGVDQIENIYVKN